MTYLEEFIQILRLGEARRDATEKIRGFLFQDLVALWLLLHEEDYAELYLEYAEDILINTSNEIKIVQVKYYPKSEIKQKEVYSDLYLQFLKKIIKDTPKDIKTYLYYNSDNGCDEDACKKYINTNFTRSQEQNVSFLDILKSKIKYDNKKDKIISQFHSEELLDNFSFSQEKLPIISELKEKIEEKLLEMFDGNFMIDNINGIKEILVSLAVDKLQGTYYKNLEERSEGIKKIELLEYINSVLSEKDSEYETLILSIISDCINESIGQIEDELTDSDLISFYNEIAVETREYFHGRLREKENRFKFINTICNKENIKKMNKARYNELSIKEEYLKFVKYKIRIEYYIKKVWKLIYNDSANYEEVKIDDYLNINEDCFFFKGSNDPCKFIFLSGVERSEAEREAKIIFSRVLEMVERPSKWYLDSGKIRGVYDYSYNVNEVKFNEDPFSYDLDDFSSSQFFIKCMDCLKVDCKSFDKKDDLSNTVFNLSCKQK